MPRFIDSIRPRMPPECSKEPSSTSAEMSVKVIYSSVSEGIVMFNWILKFKRISEPSLNSIFESFIIEAVMFIGYMPYLFTICGIINPKSVV